VMRRSDRCRISLYFFPLHAPHHHKHTIIPYHHSPYFSSIYLVVPVLILFKRFASLPSSSLVPFCRLSQGLYPIDYGPSVFIFRVT
jgi:hypothetical protein